MISLTTLRQVSQLYYCPPTLIPVLLIPMRSVDSKDSPHPCIEHERLLIAIEVIAANLESASGSVLGQDVEVASRPDAELRTFPFREWIVSEDGRAVRVGEFLPDMSMKIEDAVA